MDISKIELRLARRDEADTVNALYRMVVGRGYCSWDNEYPGPVQIADDLDHDDLFVLEYRGKIIGAISISPQIDMSGQNCWSSDECVGEFARVVIHPEYQGLHLAKLMVSKLLSVMRERGYENVHISVEKHNIPAQRTYKSLGFVNAGEASMWGRDFYLYELKLDVPDTEDSLQ